MEHIFKDKVALVTGASGGIGAAIALKLAKEGAAVIVHFNSSQKDAEEVVKKIKNDGGKAEMVAADLSNTSGTAQLISHIDQFFGGIYSGHLDILVNNAGTLVFGEMMDASDEDFDKVFNVNVRSAFQLSREAARRMTQAKWGRIITIGSVFGSATPSPELSIYSASKFAIQGFTRAWSRDLGPNGITVNNIQPAVIQSNPLPTEDPTFDAMKKYTSVGRFGTPKEIADAVAFLAHPNSGFINGATLNVDGGWNA